MRIIVGLGNPGIRYRNTRHNAGFLVVKALAERNAISLRKKAFGGRYGAGKACGHEVLLFEPLTYMNLSGEAVKSICASRLEEKENLLVVSDDINLPLGDIRLRARGSAGGHNGLKSIITHLGNDFARLRVGVGAGTRVEDLSGYVLAPLARKDRPLFNEGIQKAASCVEMWLTHGITSAMARYNEKAAEAPE